MELRELRRSNQVENLFRENFGPDEDLWSPKCFDVLFGLKDGRRLLGACTLQLAPDGYWILGDVCTAEHGKGHGTELIRQVCIATPGTIWADATCPASEGILTRNGFRETVVRPWDEVVKAYIREETK
jgi:hypothetical protein